jgi:hypothetical protein
VVALSGFPDRFVQYAKKAVRLETRKQIFTDFVDVEEVGFSGIITLQKFADID